MTDIPNISDVHPDYSNATDIRFMGPVHECVCGSNLWRITATFEDYEISMYFLDMECVMCGTKATAPTPIDHPDYVPED